MKKLIVGAVMAGAAVAALRRFGPAFHELALDKCEQMFDRMPADFPPKRMMRGIEQIHAQNEAILQRLDEESKALSAV